MSPKTEPSRYRRDNQRRQKGKMVAQGDCVMVHFDYENQTKAPIPDAVRARLNEHLIPAAE